MHYSLFRIVMSGWFVFFPLVMHEATPPPGHKAGICYPKEDPRDRGSALAEVGAATAMDWGLGTYTGHDDEVRANGIEWLPMQYGCFVNSAALADYAVNHQGSRWLILNEPDHSSQANCTPQQAADAYHQAREAILTADPQAQLFCCGTAFYPAHIDYHQAWSEAYYTTYGDWPELEGFHIHSYSAEWDDRFDYAARQQELVAFRAWQQAQDWAQDKPVIISEWAVLSGIWWAEDKARIASEYIPEMLPWLNAQPWIAAHLWFSSWAGSVTFEPSNIFEEDSGALTIVGQAWKDAHLVE